MLFIGIFYKNSNIMSIRKLYNNVCRTCLTESNNMKSIFNLEELPKPALHLHEILMACSSIKVIKGDGFPEQICHNCVEEMNRAYVFRILCEKSDAKLRHSSIIDEENQICLSNQLVDDKSFLTDFESVLKEPDKNYFESDNLSENYGNDFNESSDDEKLKDELNKRLTIHGKSFKCQLCDKEFKSKSTLWRHKSTHKSKGENQQRSTSKPHRNKTEIVKNRNLPRTCTICNKTFRFHSNLERHKLTHSGERPYLCNVCGKGFAQLSYLKIHSFIHSGEKPYKCETCGKSFAAPGTLMTHVRTHTGERPHVCKICGKDFPQSGYLATHIRTHTGEKPAECNVCNRRFNQRGRLIVHMRIHSGEKPYSCNECGRSFAVKGTLNKHIRTHTGEKPYVCSICGQAFAQNGTLATHMKIHNRNE